MSDNIIKDDWLSEIIEKDTYKLLLDDRTVAETEDFFHNWLDKQQGKKFFVYSKVPTNKLSYIYFLEKSGFNLIETSVKLKKLATSQASIELSNNCKLRHTKPKDKKRVVDLAKNNFTYSRFHVDPTIKNSIANNIKGKWVENFYHGNRGDQMFVASVSEKITGFLLLIKDNQKLIIDLIAVDSKYQGQKIAADMILYAESHIEYSEFIVGTQVINIPSIRLYENLGFKMYSSEYVFHFHQ